MPDVPNLLDLEGLDAGYYMPGDDAQRDGTFDVLGIDERRSIEDLDTPWMYFERHHGGHAPFRGAGWEGDWHRFVDEFAGDSGKHSRWYERAVDCAVEDFEDRLEAIEARGELEDTLVVVTSDHGEYLGESGLVGHSSPIRPEGVYVPTVFVHPSLDDRRAPGIMRHVDLFPTALDALAIDPPGDVDGKSLLRFSPAWGFTCAISNLYLRGKPRRIYAAESVWDADGGWVRNVTGPLRRVAIVGRLLLGSGWKSKHLRRNLSDVVAAAAHYLRSSQQFGEPGFTRHQADERLAAIGEAEPVAEARTGEIDDSTEDRLEDLGYL